MYTNGFTGQQYLSLIQVEHFDGASAQCVMTLGEFHNESEHIELCSSQSHASVEIALDLVTGECVRMY